VGAPLQSHSVSDFVRIALGLELDKHVVNDPELYRPTEVCWPSIRSRLKPNWAGAKKTDFAGLVNDVATDCAGLGIDVPFVRNAEVG